MVAALFLASVLQFLPQDADLAYDLAASLVENCPSRDAGTVGGTLAASYLLNRVSAVTGANVRLDRFTDDTPLGPRRMQNLYAEFRGLRAADDGWFVVLSHYDTKPGVSCPGANDGASTSGLLAGLAAVLFRNREFPGNVLLVWTDGEECREAYSATDGFHGSRRAAQQCEERGYRLKAVICADMLGDRELKISLPKNCSPELVRCAHQAAANLGRPELVGDTQLLVKDDHLAFLERGIPAIDLIDFEFGSAPGKNDYWHSPADTMDKVSKDSLLVSGRLIVEMLNLLSAPKTVDKKP